MVAGIQRRAEIWDVERWRAYNEELTSDEIAELMQEEEI